MAQHRVFDRLGEIAGEYLRKGSQVYIEGRLSTRKWQDKEGNDRYTTEIIADQMQMLGSRGGGGPGDAPPMRRRCSAKRQCAAQSGRARRQAARQSRSRKAADRYDSSTSDFGDDIDDDIPF